MELMKNLRWICRVCTVNIKKRRSTQSAVSIFETPELCEKLKRYLYIEIDPGDDLPKKICGNCFKRIESFHSFASLANKTENFLNDFIKIAKGNILSGRSTPSVDVDSLNLKFQNEFASFALLTSATTTGNNNDNKDSLFINNDDLPVNDAGELILNVSVSDPLIKDIENKIDLATKRRRKLEFIERNLNKVTITPTTTTTPSSSSSTAAATTTTGNTSLITNSSEQIDIKNILQNRSRSLPENILKSINNGAQATHNQNITSQLQQQQQDVFNRYSSSATYDCLNLGSVIKDMDLLKLILKALKWPYTKDTLQIQIQKLKNTRLRDVITDPNLLQDTDMTQILRSYLSPAAALLQQQQQQQSSSSSPQHNNNSTVFNSLTANLSSPGSTSATTSAATVAALNSLVSYRIPADTSVQLISVPSNDSKQNNTSFDHNNQDYYHFNEYNHYHHNNHHHHHHNHNYNDQQNISSTTMTSMKSFSKIRRLSSTASPIIVSDDDDSNNDNDIDHDNDVQLFEVSVDPRLYFPGDKEFFFNQYNNTDTYMENYSPNTTKSSSNYKNDQNDMNLKSKTKVRKKQKKKESTTITGGSRNSKNTKNSKRKSSVQQKHQQNIATTTTAAGTVATTTTTKTKKSTCIKSTIIQDDEGFKDFDIDSITLIEEASGDDEVWADFKVTESPEHDADNRPNEQLIHIKKETIDNDIENSLSSQNISNNNTNSTIITNTSQIDKKSIIEDDKIITNKIKPKTEIKPTDEESSLRALETQSNSNPNINKNTNPDNLSSTKSEQQQNCEPIKKKSTKRKNAQQKITRVSPRTATPSTTATVVAEATTTTTTTTLSPSSSSNSRITRPKSPRNYFNKRSQRNKKEKSESPKSQTDKKQQKVTTTVEKEEVAQSSRKSNARKRICKQCGLTFTNIIDFVEHRKEHM